MSKYPYMATRKVGGTAAPGGYQVQELFNLAFTIYAPVDLQKGVGSDMVL